MPNIYFNNDIRDIFTDYASCMGGVNISTDQGVFTVDLADYERVKLLHDYILTAIRGHDPATRTSHPMPPGGPLPPDQIAKFAQWIADGMPENGPIA